MENGTIVSYQDGNTNRPCYFGLPPNGTFLPWEEISAVKDSGSLIWINRKGVSFPSWFCENRASILNVPLFHMLVEKYCAH